MSKMEGNSPEASGTHLYSIKLHGDDILIGLSQRAACCNGWECGQIPNLMLGCALPNCGTMSKVLNFSLPGSSPLRGSNDFLTWKGCCAH